MDAFDLRQWKGFLSAGGVNSLSTIIDQIVIDTRRIDSRHSLFVALKGEKEDGHHYILQAAEAGAKFALVSHEWQPSWTHPSLKLLRVSSPLLAFQEIAKAYRSQLPAKIIGVTGSFGKTMVKDFLFSLLESKKCVVASPESFNSQIGVPLSLLTIRKHHTIAIIEAAISQRQEMDILADLIKPDCTILTPVGKKHLATLQDIPTLVEEKMKLPIATSARGWSLLIRDSEVEKYCPRISCPYFYWNEFHKDLPHASPLSSAPLSMYQVSFPNGISFQEHIKSGHSYFLNLLNMAIKAAWLEEVESSHIISVLESYQPEPSRTEIWKSSIGSLFINESYCSDPQSVDHALRHFEYANTENPKIFVFGGIRGKHSFFKTDYRRIGKVLAKNQIQQLLLVGQHSFEPLIEEVEQHSASTKILTFNNYNETLSYLHDHLEGKETIIFKGEKKLSLDLLTETFIDGLANNQCTINLAAIRDNLSLLRKKLPIGSRIMVAVKAQAYGTDDIRIAKFLTTCGIDIFCVSYVDEGVALRRAGVSQSIFAINAAPYEVKKVATFDLEVGISDPLLISALAKEASILHKKIKVHLHVDTGMGRLGCRPEEALELALNIQSHSSLELEGIMTHFACAEDPKQDAFTLSQIALFDRVHEQIKSAGINIPWRHAANSSGALRFHLPQYNMVRLGLAIYGLYVSKASQEALDLRLALSLTSRIVGINICHKGETISYGRRYQVQREIEQIAVLSIGYFDGLHRNYSGKAHVLIRGQKAQMIGNICMDYMMVDVTDIPNVTVGDKVLIFGEDEFGCYLSPEELASSGDSIVHELITCLGPRIQRIFVYEEGKQIR